MCNLNLQQNTPSIWCFFSLERIIHAVNGIPGRGTGEGGLRMAEQVEAIRNNSKKTLTL